MRSGKALCLASGATFGAMGIFAKLSYDEGANVGTALAVRFMLAAGLFWLILAALGALHEIRALPPRDIAAGLALGGCGYALQAGCYFLALEHIDVSLLSILLYTYPAIVAAAAFALGRDALGGRKLLALALALGGLVLVLAGAGTGELDAAGAALGLGAATAYSTYILVSDGVVQRVHWRPLTTLVCTGAAVTLVVTSGVLGQLRLGEVTPMGWGWLLCLAVISTVTSISLFFAGLRRVGPTSAAILATFEPLVTMLLAFLIFGERLAAVQIAGGALVLSAVMVLNTPARRVLRAQQAAA